jgi:hypothetical protein
MSRLLATAIAGLLAAVVVGAVGAAGQAVEPCRAQEMRAGFSVVRGSAGAKDVSYALTLTNRWPQECTLTGLPQVRLLAKRGRSLPTHVVPLRPEAPTTALVTVKAQGRARATARLSATVRGRAEPADGPCEPLAYHLRVRLTGGSIVAPITPPTRVCARGLLQFSAYEVP